MRYLIAPAVILAACSTSDPIDAFVGSYTYYRSTVSTSCDNGAPQVSDLVGGFTLTREGDQLAIDRASQYPLFVVASGDCAPKFTVGETQADIVPQGTCILTTTNNTAIDVIYTLYQLRLANVNGPDLAPMTPGLVIDLDADLSSQNGHCLVTSSPTAIITS